jgi:hypothetical protein
VLYQGHDFSRAVMDGKRMGFRACVRTRIYEFSPAGTAELSPGRQSWVAFEGRPVPQGRLKIGLDAILDNLQPSLRDLIMLHDVPRTSVLG